MLTAFQVQRVCHYAPMSRIFNMLLPLNASLELGEITTPVRAAMYLAQLAHESAEFRYLEEIADGSHYDIRVSPALAHRLGNVQPGDGCRFKGRGAIQLTGRTNYARASTALGLDLVEHPELAALPAHAFQVSAWFWKDRGCNAPADAGDVAGCTRIINGGLNGLDFRVGYYKRALEALGIERNV